MAKTMLSRWLLVAVLGVGGLGLAACGDDDDDGGASDTTAADDGGGGGGGGDSVEISGFTFPDEVTADAGAVVTFTNADGAPHTVTSDDDAFESSGQIPGGGEGEITAPDEPGEYTFHCEIHDTMSSTLVVS